MTPKEIYIFILLTLISLLTCSPDKYESIEHKATLPLERYSTAKTAIEDNRISLAAGLKEAQNVSARDSILKTAGEQLQKTLDEEFFPCWLGTPWDFNGISATPGQGKIACGYFVTTLLRDAGVNLQRYRLAQQTSETMITSMISRDRIMRFSDYSIEEFIRTLIDTGPGIYIVGLDRHTGFISVSDERASFVHSSYLEPRMVIREKALDSPILKGSRYRVTGHLTADKRFLEGWLTGSEFKVKL